MNPSAWVNASTSRPSVANAVGSVITHNPAVYECFRQKLLNYHALAASIKPEVERLADRPTTINTIVVAIARLSNASQAAAGPQPSSVLREARITLASDVVDVTIKGKKSERVQILKKLVDLSSNLDEPIHLFQLSNSIKLIADESEYASMIRPSLDKMLIVKETTQLSKLDIRLPEGEMAPNFGVFLTELLYRHGVRIRHTYIGEETVLILGRDDGPAAYDILRQEIDDARTRQTTATKGTTDT
jgi:hypothetical protein